MRLKRRALKINSPYGLVLGRPEPGRRLGPEGFLPKAKLLRGSRRFGQPRSGSGHNPATPSTRLRPMPSPAAGLLCLVPSCAVQAAWVWLLTSPEPVDRQTRATAEIGADRIPPGRYRLMERLRCAERQPFGNLVYTDDDVRHQCPCHLSWRGSYRCMAESRR